MKKRGASNIEFILAFVLFVGFVVTIFYFFNPIRSVNYMDSSLNYIIGEIEKNATIELDEVSVFINSNAPDKVKFGVFGISEKKKVDARNYYGEEFDASSINSNGIKLIQIDRKIGKNKETFIILRFSEEFEEDEINNAEPIGEDKYEISTRTSRNVISEKRIEQLKQLYENNYVGLKEQLGIPNNIDFLFTLELSNKILETKRGIPGRAEIFAKGKLIEVLREDETTETGYLTIKIW